MNTLALLMVLASADPVPVPVAGRPVDFSGAAGGPFKVSYQVDKNKPLVGQPYRFGVEIRGAGQFDSVKPFDLTALSSDMIVDQVQMTNLQDHLLMIVYAVRFRAPGHIKLPRLKFVYFNPKLRAFQTTYSDQVELEIRDERGIQNVIAPELTAWATGQWVNSSQVPPTSRGLFSWALRFLERIGIRRDDNANSSEFIWLIWCVPPVISAGLFVVRRRPLPIDLARRQLNSPKGELARSVSNTLLQYLNSSGAIARRTNDVREVIAQLGETNKIAAILMQCEAIRFGGQPSDHLQRNAIAALHDWSRRP